MTTKPSKSGHLLDMETWKALKAGGHTEAELLADEPFGPIIASYSRQQAIEDGVLVDLCQFPTPESPELDDLRQMVREAGIGRLHVAMTATAFAEAVMPIGGALPAGQDLKDRLWDVLSVLRHVMGAAARARASTDRVHFKVSVYQGNGQRETVALWALIGPGDDGEPALTIMLKGED